MHAKPKRILLIEDNRAQAFFIKDMLKRYQGFQSDVIHVELLAAGLQLLEGCPMDLVLLDLSLPDSKESIVDTVRAVRAQCPSVPVLVITNADARENRVEALKAGAGDYLIKPELTVESLGHAVEKQLKGRE